MSLIVKEQRLLLTDIIRKRRSVYADAFLKQEIPDKLIEELIINATWAPNYQSTEPWRFIVLRGQHREQLGHHLLDYYQTHWSEEQFPPERYESVKKYPQNSTMIAIIFKRHPKVKIKEWEELAAVACAVQNLWLSCSASGLGGYWDSTDGSIDYVERLGLGKNERSLGIFHLGYPKEEPSPKRRRKLLRKKLSWLE